MFRATPAAAFRETAPPDGILMPRTHSLSYCAERVRRYDNDRFLTALFAPEEPRESLFALYAFNLEIAQVRERVTEPLLGRVRLSWWRETVDAVFAGKPLRYEVAKALAVAVRRSGLSRERLERLIDAREFDLEERPPVTLGELLAYAEASSSPLVALAVEALDVRDGAAFAAARHVGIAWALAGLLRAVPFHAKSGKVYLPGAILEREGAAAADVLAGRPTPAISAVVGTVAEEAWFHLDVARRMQCGVPRQALPALLLATLADMYLDQLRRRGFDPYGSGVVGTKPAKLLRLWGSARRGRF